MIYGVVEIKEMQEADLEALTLIAADARIWELQFAPYEDPVYFRTKWFAKAMQDKEAGERLPFVIVNQGKVAGSSSFYEISLDHKRANLGYTWYSPEYWGGALNPTAKLLLLDYGFNVLDLNRIGFSIDSENKRGYRALEKIGADFEGVLKNHIIRPNGTIRHSCYFSFIKEDWPQKRQKLIELIGGFND